MAARKKPLHPLRIEEMREKIRSTLLIKRLENHVFATENDSDLGNKVMTGDQVRAALGLLGKTLPDLKATEHTGKDGETLLPTIINVLGA